MSSAQERAYRELSPRWCLAYTGAEMEFAQVFGNDNPVYCEIGFGMGSATATIAQAYPDNNYLGIEVFKAGVGKLLWETDRRHIGNIRIIEHDAVEALHNMVADSSVAGFHIFFPDPWPKKKHHKRRLVQRPFTELLVRKLRPGGSIYMVSDWSEYADFALEELSCTTGLCNAYDAFAAPQAWRPQTKFERKGLAREHEIRELFFTKELR